MTRRKVGLALGGGGARGLAHIGFLEVLQKENIPVDFIAGASSGAMVGGIYALTGNTALVKESALEVDRGAMASLMDFTLSRSGLVAGRRIKAYLQRVVGAETQFGDLRLPLACVAADISACEEVVIRDGLLWEAIRASVSIPVIFSAVKWRGRYLVDGGLMNPLPATVAREMGADLVIAVNVIPDVGERALCPAQWDRPQPKQPGIFTVALQTLQIGSSLLARDGEEQADVIVKPSVSRVGYLEFFRAAEAIEEGAIAARTALPEIRKRLESPSEPQNPPPVS